MATDLNGLTAVVTGGGSGIGQAMCLTWAEAGMNVVVADVLGERAEETARQVEAKGVRALAVACDVGDAGSVEALAERAYQAFGQVNVLCNNAGVVQFGPVTLAPQADWDWLFRVNLWGVVNVIRAFVPRLRAQGEDGLRHIVNTASLSGIFAVPGLGVYTASKYAVVGISETLRDELKKDGIGVSVLCPGPTPSRINETARVATEPGRRPLDEAGQFSFTETRTAADVAASVKAGVLAGRLYIFSHPGGRRAAERRFKEMLADFEAVA